MNFGTFNPRIKPSYKILTESGPRKTTRPVAHHYLRLVTNLVPSTLNEAQPIKSEMDVDGAPIATEPEWMKDKKW
jgi:hypothetical protein